MIVSRSNFQAVVAEIERAKKRALDTETEGLRPYHGHKLFSLIIATSETRVFYFNFKHYEGLPPENTLLPSHLRALAPLLAQDVVWYLHNSKFDMAILAQDGLRLGGVIHCTKAMARVEYNEHPAYGLADCAERIDFKKDEAVENYIDEQGLWEWETIPGKKQRKKNLHFDSVPFAIIQPYAETDATLCYRLGIRQEEAFARIAQAEDAEALCIHKANPDAKAPPRHRLIEDNERALTRVVFDMEERGVLVDRAYTERAAKYEADRAEKALQAFQAETGRAFSASSKLFTEVFESERAKWLYTPKGNPSFDANVFATFENPAARHVLQYRDAKSKHDFYLGFLYHSDSNGILHPHFNPDGTRTGRFSSSDPNLQNLTSEEGLEEQEFLVRRAIIPRPGRLFLLPDYDQMEYRMMLDYAQEMTLIAKVLGGLDVHQATADMMGVSRKEAKTINFMLLYGGGVAKLCIALFKPTVSETLLKEIVTRYLYSRPLPTGQAPTEFDPAVLKFNLGELEKAQGLRDKYFAVLPGVQAFIKATELAAKTDFFIRNWAGRRCYYKNAQATYTATNTLIQGGTADVNKFGLVAIDKYLASMRSKLVLTIHDENPIEADEDEADEVAQRVKEIMESIYPHKHLPLTVGMEYSRKSLGDKVKGFPNAVDTK